jgi:hypothetical protein
MQMNDAGKAFQIPQRNTSQRIFAHRTNISCRCLRIHFYVDDVQQMQRQRVSEKLSVVLLRRVALLYKGPSALFDCNSNLGERGGEQDPGSKTRENEYKKKVGHVATSDGAVT